MEKVKTEHLPFLVLGEFHLSSQKAKEAVIATLLRCGLRQPKGGWEQAIVNWNVGKHASKFSFFDMVREARRTGIITDIQRNLDRQDAVFGGKVGGSMSTPNHQLKLTAEYAGFSVESQGPCRHAFVEHDLTEDILYFRKCACTHSKEHDFVLTCRCFRNYLAACISIVDAFVNRHVLIAKANGITSPEWDDLEKVRKVEERIQLWWKACCNGNLQALFGSKHWCRFQQLRERRNLLLHAVEPIAVYSLPRMQEYLNKVRSGIGELLLLMRKAQGLTTLGFIEQLRTAPLVAYQKLRLTSNGDVLESTKNGSD